ncbi:hypothetical protein BX600DRAFT_476398 [Xylariales sp. PMI_506]|nr:hypothetical protein BX600DRAFT_476398 [Xylariales sp. PMI_506]
MQAGSQGTDRPSLSYISARGCILAVVCGKFGSGRTMYRLADRAVRRGLCARKKKKHPPFGRCRSRLSFIVAFLGSLSIKWSTLLYLVSWLRMHVLLPFS